MHPHHSYPQQGWNSNTLQPQWQMQHMTRGREHHAAAPTQGMNMNMQQLQQLQQLQPSMHMWGPAWPILQNHNNTNGIPPQHQLQMQQPHNQNLIQLPTFHNGNPHSHRHQFHHQVSADPETMNHRMPQSSDHELASMVLAELEAAGNDQMKINSEKQKEPLMAVAPVPNASQKTKVSKVAAAKPVASAPAVSKSATVASKSDVTQSTKNDVTVLVRDHGATKHGTTKGEESAIAALACIFPGKLFVKIRPDWLRNDRTGRLLELDLYNHELRLALEHSGPSHYVYPNSLHKTREEFDAQVFRDKLKQKLCAEAGVLIIVVPFSVSHKTMGVYIRSEMERLTETESHLCMDANA